MTAMPTPDKEKLYAHAAALCARREYCRTDILRKLLQRGLQRDEADDILDRLVEKHFIDEERYATAFVHDKTQYDRWGRIKTRQALLMKGVSEEHVATAMEQIDDEQYREALRELLRAKQRSVTAQTPYERRQKLVRYAAGRGYEADIIFSVLSEIGEDDDL